jgi:hypothetical protein
MSKKQKPDSIIQTTPNKTAAGRPTMVYLASQIAIVPTPMVTGVQEYHLNLIGIADGNIKEGQANIIYDLVTPEICTRIEIIR